MNNLTNNYKRIIQAMFLLVTIIPITLYASGGNQTGTVFYIDSKLVDCHGVIPQRCMLIKKENESDWSFFYDNIEGFEYEEGYRYTLLVNVTRIENPPQDASSLDYKLIKIIKKTCEDC